MATRKPLTHSPPSPETLSHFSGFPWTAPFFSDPSLTPVTNESRAIYLNNSRDSLLSLTLATPTTIPCWQNFHQAPTAQYPEGQVIALVKLDSGVNGHTDTAHGGFLGVLLDEVIGMACEDERKMMTAYLNVGFKKPVATPSVVLCRGWVTKREGRKIWAKGTIEDGKGVVMADGEALFVSVEREGKL